MTTDPDQIRRDDESSLRAVLTSPVAVDVDGVLARAGRDAARRRRRTVATRSAGIALAAGVVAAALAVVPRIASPAPAEPDTTTPTAIATTETPTDDPAESTPTEPESTPTEPESTPTEPESTDSSADLPYQPTPPTQPEDPERILGSQDENAWPIPDPRPTTPGPLAELPVYQMLYGPYQTPLMGLACDATIEDAQNATEQVGAGAILWSHLDPLAPDRSIDIVVTGWDDASLAYTEITTNTGFCVWPDGQHEVPWPGSDVEADRYLDDDGVAASALELVGDYTVAVTVWDEDAAPEDRQGDAVEVAEDIVATLIALDPERAG